MKLAVQLDDTITDADARLGLWQKINSGMELTLTSQRVLGQLDFWTGMQPNGEWLFFRQLMEDFDVYILSERPTSLHAPTCAWLARHGWEIARDKVICQSLQRYDCRILGIDFYIDTNLTRCNAFQYDHTQAVLLNRFKHGLNDIKPWVRSIEFPEEIYDLQYEKKAVWTNV